VSFESIMDYGRYWPSWFLINAFTNHGLKCCLLGSCSLLAVEGTRVAILILITVEEWWCLRSNRCFAFVREWQLDLVRSFGRSSSLFCRAFSGIFFDRLRLNVNFTLLFRAEFYFLLALSFLRSTWPFLNNRFAFRSLLRLASEFSLPAIVYCCLAVPKPCALMVCFLNVLHDLLDLTILV